MNGVSSSAPRLEDQKDSLGIRVKNWFKRIFVSDYDRGIQDSQVIFKHEPKTNFIAAPEIIEKEILKEANKKATITKSEQGEGRQRKVYHGRSEPTKHFDFPVCSTFAPGAITSCGYILFENAPRELQEKFNKKITNKKHIDLYDTSTGIRKKVGSVFYDKD